MANLLPKDVEEGLAKYQFTQSLGEAFVAWQNVELMLHNIFFILFRPNEATTAAINAVYHAVISAELRIKMVDALVVAQVSDPELLSKWKTLLNRLKRKKKIRDKLAHWSVVSHTKEEEFEGLFLCPPISDSRNIMRKDFLQPTSGAMNLDNIKEHIKSFVALQSDLRAFLVLLLPKP